MALTFKASLVALIAVGGIGFLVGLIDSPHSKATPGNLNSYKDTEQMISRQVISEGEFWGIAIGSHKGDVIRRLQALRIEAVMPEEKEKIIVTHPNDLEKLATAEGIVWIPGDVRIRFAKDAVIDRQVLLTDEKWAGPLRNATTRSGVFAILKDALMSDEGIKIGNYAPDIRWVLVEETTEEDRFLLEKYDTWTLNHGDPTMGFWHIRLQFTDDRLLKINTISSPVEFP